MVGSVSSSGLVSSWTGQIPLRVSLTIRVSPPFFSFFPRCALWLGGFGTADFCATMPPIPNEMRAARSQKTSRCRLVAARRPSALKGAGCGRCGARRASGCGALKLMQWGRVVKEDRLDWYHMLGKNASENACPPDQRLATVYRKPFLTSSPRNVQAYSVQHL